MKAYHLEITSYCGHGGEHYYGSLKWTGTTDGLERFELQHSLSQREATYLNKKDKASWTRYKKGGLTELCADIPRK